MTKVASSIYIHHLGYILKFYDECGYLYLIKEEDVDDFEGNNFKAICEAKRTKIDIETIRPFVKPYLVKSLTKMGVHL